MNYTAKDIEKAKELKSMGYNWIATNKNGRPFAYGRMPYRCADDSNEYNIWDNQPGTPWLMLSKEYFKSITWENEPVYIDEIITGWKVRANRDTVIDRLTADRDEWKRRAEVAERALKIAATRLKCYGGLGEGFCTVSDCEYHHCSNDEGCVLAHLRKAERELAEERKE